MILLIISILFLIVAAILFLFSMKFKFFSKQGIPGPKPKIYYGNTKESMQGKRNVTYDIDDVYRHYKGKAPFVGFFMGFAPFYMIIDPELLKKVLIKDFKTFRNNSFSAFANAKKDPIISLNPFLLKDDEWKTTRAQISSAMTQNKFKSMFPLLLDTTKHLIEFIENDPVGVDIRDASSRYTCDAICNCLLGIEAHSFTCENPEIYEHSKKMLAKLNSESVKMFPRKFTPPESDKFFSKLFMDSINYRVENKIERDDFLAHIIANREKKSLSEIETVAQTWAIYMDSFETSAIALHFVYYELAKNQAVQEKLRKLIVSNLDENGHFGFDKIAEVEYLDQVFYETLRLNPPLTFNTKLCSEPFELEGTKGHKFVMAPGASALIPTYSIHRDPEYYPFPDSFQPERFDAEHGGVKAFRDKSILIPFGDGPRICLGMKFAHVLVKLAIAEVIRTFKITVNDQVMSAPKIDPKCFLNMPECKLLLNFEKI